MFGAGPWQIYPFDETTHRPGRAVPIAGTIKQRQITEKNGEHSDRLLPVGHLVAPSYVSFTGHPVHKRVKLRLSE